MPHRSLEPPPPAPQRPGVCALGVPALVALVAGLVIASGRTALRPAFDQVNFHAPAVRVFAHDLPRVELDDYLSATTPLYHLLLALVARATGAGETALRAVGLVLTLALLWFVGRLACARVGCARGMALQLVLAGSGYVLFPGLWLLPDNLGWLLVVLTLAPALGRAWTTRGALLAGALLVLLVGARQSHLWVAGALWAWAWLGTQGSGDSPRARARRLAVMALGSIPAVLVVGWFAWRWGGLTPPLFQRQYEGGSLAARLAGAGPAFVLANLGLFGVFFAGSWLPRVRSLWRDRRAWILASLGGAGLLALVPATTPDPGAGRGSGLWTLAGWGPVVAGHASVVIVALAVLGGLVLLGVCLGLGARRGWIVLAGVGSFSLALSASTLIWQRYAEPLVLLVLVLGTALGEPRPGRRAWMGWAVLAGLLALGAGWQVREAGPEGRLDRGTLMRMLGQPADYPIRLEAGESRRDPDKSQR